MMDERELEEIKRVQEYMSLNHGIDFEAEFDSKSFCVHPAFFAKCMEDYKNKALAEREREIKDILIDYRHHLIGSYPHSIREAEEDVEAFLKERK